MTTKITADNIEQATLDTISGGPAIANIQIANSSYSVLDDTAVDTAGGYILINGTKFANGCTVLIGNSVATSVTFVSATQIRAQVPAKNNASYAVYVTNPDGGTAIAVNALTYSNNPVWSTGSTLPTGATDSPISISLSAPSDSNVTYTVAAGSSLPSGITLASNGLLSGTVTGLTSETTYNFTIVATDVQNQDASRAFSITISAGDFYYNYTTLHLNGETASNTWITDASTNKFAVTVSGDTRPSGFSPYETIWSNYFDGSGDYLNISSNAAFGFGTGDFTIEGWYYQTGGSGFRAFASTRDLPDETSSTTATFFGLNGSNQLYYDSYATGLNGSTALLNNTWYHVACVRSGTTVTLYLNGVSQGTVTDGANKNNRQLHIGGQGSIYFLNGYLSNFRVLKGTALYTTTFTPPTSSLTAIANTSLLTCQSNRFIDNSINAFTITKNGDVTVRNFGPFVETDIMSGSGYFDGSGDALTVPGNTAFNFGTGNFTIECWIYPIVTSGTQSIIDAWNNAPTRFLIRINSGVLQFYNSATGGNIDYTLPSAARWYHVAAVRNGTSFSLYVDGVSRGTPATSSSAITSSTAAWTISRGAETFNGYIADVRVVKGTAVYTSTFTPPTSRLTAITGTSLLTLQSRTGENNNRFVDGSGLNNIITRTGNATQGTFSPFSPSRWSNYFNGTDSILSFPNSSNFAFGAGAFTIEFWINAATASNSFILGGRNAIGGMHITLGGFGGTTSGSLRYVASSTITSGATLIADNNWHHCAIVRDGSSNITLYVDGVSRGTGTDNNNYSTTSGSFLIGRNDLGASEYLTGYLSNFRIIKGTALYTTTFTPPTSPLSAVSNTSILTCQSSNFRDTSLNNLAITVTGAPSVQPYSPFKPTGEWSADTVGGSMYFDGTDDLLRSPSLSDYSFGTGDFTIELWMYAYNFTNNPAIFAVGSDAGGLVIRAVGDTIHNYWVGAGDIFTTSSSVQFPKLQWTHLAWTRSGTSMKFFMDGVQRGSTVTSSANHSSTGGIGIGGPGTTGTAFSVFNGYISNVRINRGTALYTSNFTPPTAPVTPVAGTTFLLNDTGGGIIDYTGRNTFETVGDVKVTNNTVKYGSGSMYFDGNGDFLLNRNINNVLTFNGSSTFTVEGWFYQTAYDSTSGFMNNVIGDLTPNSTFGDALYWSIGMNSANKPGIRWYGGPTVCDATNALTLNTWNHVAWVVTNGAVKIFINGVQETLVGTTTITAAASSMGYHVIGADRGKYYTGYIDDLRITRGVARYTTNFTPPTSAFMTK